MERKLATREGYGAALVELGKEHPDVVVFDADLSEATKTVLFKKTFPQRHFDCGIAEADMMGAAAGAAAMGMVPFVSSFAMFAAGRAFEQVRNSIGYPQLNVKIGATHGGVSVGEDGASHQCCEDFALMRTIPGMVVMCPSDDVEARAAVKAAYEHKGPVYMRFGRLPVPVFHEEEKFQFQIGKGEVLTQGSDLALIATGLMTYEALQAAEALKRFGIHARVINLCTIKPLDEELVLQAAHECGKVITCEEHSVIGGLGEAVCSLLGEQLPTPVRRIGVNSAAEGIWALCRPHCGSGHRHGCVVCAISRTVYTRKRAFDWFKPAKRSFLCGRILLTILQGCSTFMIYYKLVVNGGMSDGRISKSFSVGDGNYAGHLGDGRSGDHRLFAGGICPQGLEGADHCHLHGPAGGKGAADRDTARKV